MASRLIHLAIAKRLTACLPIKDSNRFSVGHILPDAVMSADKKQANTHFIDIYDSGKMKHYDFSCFYERFGREILTDELYLGYYFHLIEDGIFRIMLYYDMDLLCRRGDPKLLSELYGDYHILNGYLVKRYGLENTLTVPNGFENEKINELYRFELDEFIRDMAADFSESLDENPTHLTLKCIEDYIEKCASVCISEYKAIARGEHFLNRYDYSFENKFVKT